MLTTSVTGMKQQQGFSLISTLIGLLISMIVILGMLAIYRTSVQVSVRATEDASQSNQKISGLLRADKHLQSAGFGLAEPEYGGTNIHLIANGSLSGGVSGTLSGTAETPSGSPRQASGNAIVWYREDDANLNGVIENSEKICEGLLARVSGNEFAGLLRLLPEDNCTGADTWGTIDWTATVLVSAPPMSAHPAMVFQVTEAEDSTESCRPFGIGDAAAPENSASGGLVVTLSTQVSTQDSVVSSTTCLANFVFPAA